MKKLLIVIFACSYQINLHPKPFPFKAATFEQLSSRMRTQERQRRQRSKTVWGKRLFSCVKRIAALEEQLQKKVVAIELEKPKRNLQNLLSTKLAETYQLALQKTPTTFLKLIEIENELNNLNKLAINDLSLTFDPLTI